MNEATEIFNWLVFIGVVREEKRNGAMSIIRQELLAGKSPEKIIRAFSIAHGFSGALSNLAQNFTELMGAFKTATEALVKLADFKPIPVHVMARLESQVDYAVAGYPYGKSVRGWKKWRKGNAWNRPAKATPIKDILAIRKLCDGLGEPYV